MSALFCETLICILTQDVQWNDIDYMDQFMDFTYDPTKFDTLPEMVKDLHAHDQRYVIILVHRRCVFVCVSLHVCVVFGLVLTVCVSTCRTRVSVAHSLRAHTGRTMKG